MKSKTLELLSEESGDVFSQAAELVKAKKKIYCSPNVITGSCSTQPTCLHCKWEYLKVHQPDFQRRRSLEEIIERTKVLNEAGIHRIFLPSGWMGYRIPDYFPKYMATVKENTEAEIYGLFGTIDLKSLLELKAAGMDGYLCGLESPSEEIYRRFRPGGDGWAERIETLRQVKKLGMKVWSGFIFGLGENQLDIMNGLKILAELEVDSVSILPFTPYPLTPMVDSDPPNPYQWAKLLAVSRIYLNNPNVFADQTEGFFSAYAKLGSANGFYVFPGKV